MSLNLHAADPFSQVSEILATKGLYTLAGIPTIIPQDSVSPIPFLMEIFSDYRCRQLATRWDLNDWRDIKTKKWSEGKGKGCKREGRM